MPTDNNCDEKPRVKLIGACVDQPPGDLERAIDALKKKLDDKTFQKAIENVFREETKKLLKHEHNRQLGGDPVLPDQDTGKRLLSGSQKAFKDLAEKELRKSHAGRKFTRDIDQLEKELKASPVGVWIDKNSGIAYIVGAVVLVGGVYGIVKTKRDIIGKPLEFIDVKKKIGSITLSGSVTSFKPGSGAYGANVGLGHGLKQVNYDVKLSGLIDKDGNISSTTSLNLVIKANRKLEITTTAKGAYTRKGETSTRMVAGIEQNSKFNRSSLTADAAIKVAYKDNDFKFQAVAAIKDVNLYSSHPGTGSRTISLSSMASKPLPRHILGDDASLSLQAGLEHNSQSGASGNIMILLGKSF